MRFLAMLTLIAMTACARARTQAALDCNDPPPVNGSAIAWQRTTGGVVKGLVTDIGGKPLAGAAVQLRGTGYGAPTDKDGRFRIERVPPRDYQVVVRGISYVPAERTISVSKDEGAQVLAVLERAPSGTIYDCWPGSSAPQPPRSGFAPFPR